jgi:hypothetical protein
VVSKSITKDGTLDHDGVSADKANKVVAPGTKNDDGITFSITGKTEVAVKLEVTATGSDVYLGKGTYPNMTNGNVYDAYYSADDDIFTTTDVYYPIKYTLSQKKGEETSYSAVKSNVTLAEIVTYLNTLDDTKSGQISANTDLNDTYGEFKLTWTWDYEFTGQDDASNSKKALQDKEDTLLGELAYTDTTDNVGTAISAVNSAYNTANSSSSGILETISSSKTVADKSYYLTPDFNLTIKVTQID